MTAEEDRAASSDDDSPDLWTEVLKDSDLASGVQKLTWFGRQRVLLYRERERVYAVADLCPHALQPINGGRIEQGVIRCPKHGACFELSSGRPTNRITDKPLTVFRVKIDAGRIMLAHG